MGMIPNFEQKSAFSWNAMSIPINGIEAMLLISLDHNSKKKLLTSNQIFELRKIIYTTDEKSKDLVEMEFTKEKLEEIEHALPLFGVVDEGRYAAFRAKISIAILGLETILIPESPVGGQEDEETNNDGIANKNVNTNSSENITRPRTRKTARPRHVVPNSKGTSGKDDN